jgi:internalin A
MTPEEEAYEEALRRICEAEKTVDVELDLSGWNKTAKKFNELYKLNRLPPELGRLTKIQSLDLSWCGQLSDISPLAALTFLRSLNLASGEMLEDLSPLAHLTSLQSLNLRGCRNLLGDLSPLAGLTSLQLLDLCGCQRLSGDLSSLAHLTSLQSLDISGCPNLLGDLSPLAGLTSLQSLDLSWCQELSGDLSPLASLTKLQSLSIDACKKLSGDLSPLAHLTKLQSLSLSFCSGFRWFAPLESLLPTLKTLRLYFCKFEDLHPEVRGEGEFDNVLDKVRAHYEDLKSGQRIDAEVKVLFLGNGGVGKTQLCRRLCDLDFDPNIPTTHGIQLGEMTVTLKNQSLPGGWYRLHNRLKEQVTRSGRGFIWRWIPDKLFSFFWRGLGFDRLALPVRLNLWDFGGQEIYHGSHALFLHGQAIFLILWTPELECQTAYQEGALSFRHRPLPYWLDYLRAFAGTDASALIVQSQCDSARDRASHPPVIVDDFFPLRWLEVSAKTGLGLNLVKAALEESVRDRFERRPPPPPIGVGRLKVRDRLRQMLEEDQKREPDKRQHRLLERAKFDRLCDEVGGVSDPSALLDFLHHNGVVFHRLGLFGNRIVLDQNWALEAIYALFDRKKILPLLRGYGRFNRADLEALIWSDYTPEEQEVFLGMMESCGICFRVRELPRASNGSDEAENEEEWEYVAPELLPTWSDAQEQLLGRLRDDPPDAEATASYPFLHEGVLRGFLSKLGAHAKDAAIYWKYGCWFYEQTTRSQVLIESRWKDVASEVGAGEIRFRAWGENAENLIDLVLDPLRKLPIGQPPEIKQIKTFRAQGKILFTGSAMPRYVQTPLSDDAISSSHVLDQLQVTARPEITHKGTPEIFVSYAWGDDSSDDARKRTEVVDRLCETLG